MVIFKKNASELSKKDINRLANASLRKIWWIWALVPAVGLILGVIGLLFGEDAEDTMYAISLIVATPICLCLFFFIFRSIISTSIKNQHKLVKSGATYEFSETGLKASEAGLNIQMVSEINYPYYKKVVENETSYIFYTHENGVFAIQKSDLCSGTLLEFNLILVTAYGENFKPFREKN